MVSLLSMLCPFKDIVKTETKWKSEGAMAGEYGWMRAIKLLSIDEVTHPTVIDCKDVGLALSC